MRHIYLTLALLLFTSELLAQTRGASRVVGKEDVLSGFYDKTWAVIIGIDEYPSLSYNLQLQQAVKDAEGVRKALEDSYRFDKIITLYNEEATRDGIVEVLLGQLRKAGENDGVFVFFAGHGNTISTVDGDLGYLLPYDGSFDEKKLYKNISMTTLKNDVAKAVPAKHIFFVMDACYSGLLLAQRGPGDDEPAAERLDYLKEVTKERARQVLSAGGKGQTVLDGGRNGHSVFTGRLIQALEEADGYITAKEIGYGVPEKVFYDAQDRGHKQQPQFGRLAGQGDFVFLKRPASTVSKIAEAKEEEAQYSDQVAALKAQLWAEREKQVEEKAAWEAAKKQRNEAEELQKQLDELKRKRERPSVPKPRPSQPTGGSKGGEMVHVSDYGFHIDKFEATNREYADFVRSSGHRAPESAGSGKAPWNTWSGNQPPSGYEAHPVVGVSWYDAKSYCEWVGKRLPTAEEWQQACQGSDGRKYPWGSRFLPANVTIFDSANANTHGSWDGYDNTAPVGKFPGGSSPYGARDMVGNVWEWTSSLYKSGGSTRVVGGGSFANNQYGAQCDKRSYYPPDIRYYFNGFRCAR